MRNKKKYLVVPVILFSNFLRWKVNHSNLLYSMNMAQGCLLVHKPETSPETLDFPVSADRVDLSQHLLFLSRLIFFFFS